MKKVFADGREEVVQPPELIARGENNWKGWNCYIGLQNIVIDFNGIIRGGWCGVGGIIGNIEDKKFKLPVKPVLCVTTNCYCGLDIMATKVRI
jgi:hypothetical protein